MQTFPNPDEVLEIGDGLSDERRAQIKANYFDAIDPILAPWKTQLAKNDVHIADLSELIKSMFTQIKRDAHDEAHLTSLFAPLKAMILTSAS